jgi:hypothetical protein
VSKAKQCDVCRSKSGNRPHYTRHDGVVMCMDCWYQSEIAKGAQPFKAEKLYTGAKLPGFVDGAPQPAQCAEEIEVLPNGAKQSKVQVRMDLLPWAALMQVAEVLHHGAEKYGDDNWRGIPADSHLNHALRHVALHKAGDTSEPHASHIACRILMWLETLITEANNRKVKDDELSTSGG